MNEFKFKKEQKTEQMNVRVTRSMLEQIRKIANQEGVGEVEAIRGLLEYVIDEYLEQRPIIPLTVNSLQDK